MTIRWLLAAAAVAAASRSLSAQSLADTTAVLELVGRSYRSSTDWGIAIRLLDRGDAAAVTSPTTPAALGERYARMVATGGMMPLLTQLPEAICDEVALEPASPVRRPWLGSAMLLLSLTFSGDTAVVVGLQDVGEHPCPEYRIPRESSWRLARIGTEWRVLESWVSTFY